MHGCHPLQSEWAEMLVTSGPEVVVPCGTDDIVILHDKCTGSGEVALRQAPAAHEIDPGLDPVLPLSIRRHDPSVHQDLGKSHSSRPLPNVFMRGTDGAAPMEPLPAHRSERQPVGGNANSVAQRWTGDDEGLTPAPTIVVISRRSQEPSTLVPIRCRVVRVVVREPPYVVPPPSHAQRDLDADAGDPDTDGNAGRQDWAQRKRDCCDVAVS